MDLENLDSITDVVDEIGFIIQALQSTSSRNDKIKILEINKDNMLWLYILKFLFDPMVVTGISDKKLEKGCQTDYVLDPWEMMEYLRIHKTGTLADVDAVVTCAKAFPDHEEWLLQLFTKSLKLGIDASTINKVYGKNFIKVFSVMLAESLTNYPDHLDGKNFIITQKMDGCRCIAFVRDNDTVQFFTRNGQDYGMVPDVAANLLNINLREVAYDGELIAVSEGDTNEVFRKTISTANSKGVKTGLVYHVFDAMSIEDFMDGFSSAPCTNRKKAIHDFIGGAALKWVVEVPRLYEGNDQSKIGEWSAIAEEKGWEGLMINVADAPYRAKRVQDLLKVKKFKTVDVRVTGVFEGEGALAGMLGGIDVEFDVDGKTYTAKCGSGFNFEQRKKYWADPNLLIGKIVELKVFELSKDVDGNYSLRFPIWLDIIRFDKDSTSVV